MARLLSSYFFKAMIHAPRESVNRYVHFLLRPGGIASPSPTRTFTFELSPPESPPQRCRISLRGQTANSRDRTFTGKTSSIMGCRQTTQNKLFQVWRDRSGDLRRGRRGL